MKSRHDLYNTNLSISNTFPLDKYFSSIGLFAYQSMPLTLETLALIIECHLNTFNYRNSLIFQAGQLPADKRSIPSLHHDELLQLMMEMKGGYCFQHLELISGALSALGFNVKKHLAKTFVHAYPLPDMSDKPKTHELLVVDIDQVRYIVDVGMGNMSLRKPLLLSKGEQYIEGDCYRIKEEDGIWTLDYKSRQDKEWLCIYRFFNLPVKDQDIDQAHANLYLTDTYLPIRDEMLLFGKATDTKRKYLLWNSNANFGIFKSIKICGDDVAKTRKFNTMDEVEAFAIKKFGFVS